MTRWPTTGGGVAVCEMKERWRMQQFHQDDWGQGWGPSEDGNGGGACTVVAGRALLERRKRRRY